jgi:transcriptional regulator with XRE-family HTH domain
MLLRDALGETLRDARTRQNRTLRDVSTAANVSLGYLSEVERGRKEASSELLASICDALELELSDVLDTASSALRVSVLPAKAAVTANSAKPGAAPEKGTGNSIRIVLPYRPTPSAPSIA